MGDIVEINNLKVTSSEENKDKSDLIQITESLLLDTRTNIKNLSTISIPIAELATLGSGVSSLLPSLRTVTTTTSIDMQGLFTVKNLATGDILKMAKIKLIGVQ